jgi:hypothetical protein
MSQIANAPPDPRYYNPDGSLKSFKGQNGGPRPGAGRPKGVPNGPQAQFKQLARKFTEPAMYELARIAGLAQRKDRDGNLLFKPNGDPDMIPGSPSDTARIAAINALLERGWGKARRDQGEDETPLGSRQERIVIERVVVDVGVPFDINRPDLVSTPDQAEEQDRDT